jgi:hypothetical protein
MEFGQVVVHCNYFSAGISLIRIWDNVSLYDQHSPHRSALVYAHNINTYPSGGSWMEVGPGPYQFTLIFEGLPKSCILFDLIEKCNGGSGAFEFRAIPRNNQDVYYLDV